MTNIELKQLRILLCLSTEEAAQNIPSTPKKARAWQRWESGDRSIPEDVIKKMTSLAFQQQSLLKESIENSKAPVYYDNYQDFILDTATSGDVVDFKISQSIAIGFTANFYYKMSE